MKGHIMKIDTKEIIKGDSLYIGKKLWISEFKREDLDKKASRFIRPQRALLRSNSEINSNKRIYYSDNHFVGLNKKGELLKSKIIAIFDNTGYRSYTGTSIKIFDNEQECRDSFVAQAEEIGQRVDIMIESSKKYWEDVRSEINSEIINNWKY